MLEDCLLVQSLFLLNCSVLLCNQIVPFLDVSDWNNHTGLFHRLCLGSCYKRLQSVLVNKTAMTALDDYTTKCSAVFADIGHAHARVLEAGEANS